MYSGSDHKDDLWNYFYRGICAFAVARPGQRGCEPVGEGVWELRIDWGPGYRVYYARAGEKILLLLCGGDKRKQQADIKRAKDYWHDYKERTAPQGRRPG